MLPGLPAQRSTPPFAWIRLIRSNATVFLRQTGEAAIKRERWTEDEIDALPPGEHDYFERKSGRLFEDRQAFLKHVRKAASAFANSGGGSLVLGVDNEGVPDGLPPFEGRTSIRDWLEQKVPGLLDYPLSDFRVHIVERKLEGSRISPEREVVVIDFGDSALAPHQDREAKVYYHRSAGRSEPAPHFYIELLRQRLTHPALDFEIFEIRPNTAYFDEGSIFVELDLTFSIENTGRIAAYKWALTVRHYSVDQERFEDFHYGRTHFPKRGPRTASIPIDTTILPGCSGRDLHYIGVRLRPTSVDAESIRAELAKVLKPVVVSYQLATETSPGTIKEVALAEHLDTASLADFVIQQIGPK